MNNLKKYLFASASLAMLVGCSDDVTNGSGNKGGVLEDGPGVYVGVNFQMPGMGGTRSTTIEPDDNQSASNTGTEVGKDYENNVNEVYIILARKSDFGYIGSAKVLGDYIYKHSSGTTTGNAGSYHATAKFEKADINEYYDKEGVEGVISEEDSKVAVFVIVNPTDGMEKYIAALEETEGGAYGNTDWYNQAWKVASSNTGANEGSIWSTSNGGNFLMSNSRIAIRQIPTRMTDWDLFSSTSEVFHLSELNKIQADYTIDNSVSAAGGNGGPVNVQRAAARFDFRDGSEEGDNTYPAIFMRDATGNDTKKPLISVQFQTLSLVNMNNTFYYFERVSKDGRMATPIAGNYAADPAGQWELCSPEMPWYNNMADINSNQPLINPAGGNYVVDYYWQQKYDGTLNKFKDFKFDEYFDYPLFDNNGLLNTTGLENKDRWGTVYISDILKNETDQYDGDGATEYHIWRYVTENTIPLVNTPYEYYQANGISTGIVFRAKMIANEECLVENATTNEDIARNNLINYINGKGDVVNDSWAAPFLYSFAKQTYVSWDDLRQAAIDASLSFTRVNGKLLPEWNRTNSLYIAVFGRGVTGMTFDETVDGEKVTVVDVDTSSAESAAFTADGVDKASANYAYDIWEAAGRPNYEKGEMTDTNGNKVNITSNFKKAVTDAGITIYQRSEEDGEWGYYCYYYYWNRHNDNNRDGIMGPMEFATVRNNVYKLSVSKVSRLGHPRLSDNDPDNPTPDTPDESSDVYITVDSKVIPWVVRINSIKF